MKLNVIICIMFRISLRTIHICLILISDIKITETLLKSIKTIKKMEDYNALQGVPVSSPLFCQFNREFWISKIRPITTGKRDSEECITKIFLELIEYNIGNGIRRIHWVVMGKVNGLCMSFFVFKFIILYLLTFINIMFTIILNCKQILWFMLIVIKNEDK